MKRYLNQRIKIRLLRVVATVASQGSLVKAAEVLGLTQPALTKSLREAEDIVGVRLFDRHARGAHANEYGTILAAAAQRILDVLSDVEHEFDRIDSRVGGSVVVGALPTAAAAVVPGVLRRLRASDPQIVVRVVEDRTNELCAALALGDIDLVVGRLYDVSDEANHFEREPLYDEPMSFIVGAGHPLASQTQVEVADIARYDISLPVSSLRIRADTMNFLGAMGLQWRDGFSTTSLILQREMLLSNDLITVMPWLLLKGDIERGTLKLLNVANIPKPPARPAGLVLRRQRPLTAPAERVATAIREFARATLPQYQ